MTHEQKYPKGCAAACINRVRKTSRRKRFGSESRVRKEVRDRRWERLSGSQLLRVAMRDARKWEWLKSQGLGLL